MTTTSPDDSTLDADALAREHRRQQALLHSLWHEPGPASLHPWLADFDPDRDGRAWQAYLANAHAHAERALTASFPTVQQLMGEEAFAAMARAYWHACPPQRGDLAWLGEQLPRFIEGSEQLAAEPYLADSARLDWAVQCSENAADEAPQLDTLTLLGTHDPADLVLQLAPGVIVVDSLYPIVSLWRAHHQAPEGEDAFAVVRQAFAQAQGETAVVWRQGWRAQVVAVDGPTACFVRALMARQPLAVALEAAGGHWRFDEWLVQAVSGGLISWLAVSEGV